MDKDQIKTMIQQALWHMYKETDVIAYKELYEQWYNNYDEIEIKGL